MMRAQLTIESDNAAFADDARGELSRILRDIAARIERGEWPLVIRDANGNRVGELLLDLRDSE